MGLERELCSSSEGVLQKRVDRKITHKKECKKEKKFLKTSLLDRKEKADGGQSWSYSKVNRRRRRGGKGKRGVGRWGGDRQSL